MLQQIVKNQTPETQRSKLLTRYQRLLKDIETKKVQQENLAQGMRVIIPKIASELKPLVETELDWQIKKIKRLEAVVNEVVISQAKYDAVVAYILKQLEGILSETRRNDKGLHLIYEKYTGRSFDPESIQLSFFAQKHIRESELAIDANEIKDDFFFDEQSSSEEPKKKSKKKRKKEQSEADEKKLLTLDAKAIYFRLIKKYHPDRQFNPQLQNEYKVISQQVTKAYKENDFMTLLRLQIEYLDDSELEASALAEDMLQRYNKILQTQLGELNNALNMAKQSLMGLFDQFFDSNFKFSEILFEQKKKVMSYRIEKLKIELEESTVQKKDWLKKWIKANTEAIEKQDKFE